LFIHVDTTHTANVIVDAMELFPNDAEVAFTTQPDTDAEPFTYDDDPLTPDAQPNIGLFCDTSTTIDDTAVDGSLIATAYTCHV